MRGKRLGDATGDAEGNDQRIGLLVPAKLVKGVALGDLAAHLAHLLVLPDVLIRVRRRGLAVRVRGHAREEARPPGRERRNGPLHDRDLDLVKVHDFVEVAQERI